MTEDIKTPKLSDSTKPAIDYSTCYKLPFLSLYNEDCFETMKRIPDNSVDLMLTDPPYNTTHCEWEYAIDFEKLWAEWLRIVKPNGAFIFTASQPFTTDLINSNRFTCFTNPICNTFCFFLSNFIGRIFKLL